MKNEIKDIPKAEHKTSIGGQALIEGIMMRGPEKISIAVRKPDGEIEIKTDKLNTFAMKHKFASLPFIRGMVGLVESMMIGVNALLYSAEFWDDEEDIEEENKEEKNSLFERIFKDKAEDVSIFLTVLLSIAISIGLFMVLPNLIVSLLRKNTNNYVLLNLVEGLVRIIIFLIYVTWVSKLEDMKRIFEYHGAEHKSIHCYEHLEELTVENIQKYPILHARCGTSFLFMVMIVSIFVLSFFGWPSPLKRILIRILMFPVIAGISYEINRVIGRSSSKLAYYLSYPGLMIQKIATVKEPSPDQIEVAIAALKEVIPEDSELDKW